MDLLEQLKLEFEKTGITVHIVDEPQDRGRWIPFRKGEREAHHYPVQCQRFIGIPDVPFASRIVLPIAEERAFKHPDIRRTTYLFRPSQVGDRLTIFFVSFK